MLVYYCLSLFPTIKLLGNPVHNYFHSFKLFWSVILKNGRCECKTRWPKMVKVVKRFPESRMQTINSHTFTSMFNFSLCLITIFLCIILNFTTQYNYASILLYSIIINTKIFKLSLNTESSDTLDTDMGFYLILGRVYHNVWPHQDIIFFFSNGSLNNMWRLYANLLALHWFKSCDDPSQLLKMLVTNIVRKSLKMKGVGDGLEEEVQGCWGNVLDVN